MIVETNRKHYTLIILVVASKVVIGQRRIYASLPKDAITGSQRRITGIHMTIRNLVLWAGNDRKRMVVGNQSTGRAHRNRVSGRRV